MFKKLIEKIGVKPLIGFGVGVFLLIFGLKFIAGLVIALSAELAFNVLSLLKLK